MNSLTARKRFESVNRRQYFNVRAIRELVLVRADSL